MLDDDILLSVPDISFAFSIWKVTNLNINVMVVESNYGQCMCSVHNLSVFSSVLQQFSEQIVGFVPRKHVLTSRGVYSYGSFELQDPETAGGDR